STEIARTLAQQGVKINTASETADYLAFLATHFQRSRESVAEFAFFERTALDVLCFMELNGDAVGWLGALTIELVRWQMPLFDVYVYIPPELPPQPDGVRMTDPELIREFDRILRDKLHLFRPNTICVRGAIADRVEAVGRVLKQGGS